MRIKNLERAFEERMGEINIQLFNGEIDNLRFEEEKGYAQVALKKLEEEKFYGVWNKYFGNFNSEGYEHDKELYFSTILFLRVGSEKISEVAKRHGLSKEEMAGVVEFRSEQLNGSLKK